MGLGRSGVKAGSPFPYRAPLRWHSPCCSRPCLRAVLPTRIAVCVIWLLAAGAGTGVLLKYEAGADRADGTPAHWPEGSQIKLDPQRGTLLLFTHSHCPCTRSSIRELN